MLFFIDMDGVVADFDRHILDTYGKPMSEMTDVEMNRFWDSECVSLRFFANSPPIYEGLRLVSQMQVAKIEMCFLTSTGGGLRHVDIAKQKLDFLQRHGFGNLPVAFATGTKCKASFANSDTFLIDDREKVVNAFRDQEGCASLFTRHNWREIFTEVYTIALEESDLYE